ncbi:MAG: translation initiation factor [Opitutaceae bacterium]|nr:translation initiation factor [Opitutaceae bacterium]
MSTSGKVPTGGGESLSQNPFGALDALKRSLPSLPDTEAQESRRMSSKSESGLVKKNRGRVDIRRMTAGRGGKTVTVIDGFVGIGLAEKESLAKAMQKRCGCGGTVKEGRIEIQGDKREDVARVLEAAGFRPVFAGG